MHHTVYLGLGTNLGDRLSNLKTAVATMQPHIVPDDCSAIYETPPWGYEDQPAFLNQAVRGRTGLAPLELLERLKKIEARMGREPDVRYGPRIIDLDILFYDHMILESERLAIPHPHLAERAFVLVPLADLKPELRHPLLNKTVRDLLAEVDTAGIKWYAPGECGKISAN